MVQRKVPCKLGIQSDHVKSEKLLGNLKPSSCQDGKSRGPDMKKKMKRSRSIKLSDVDSLKSTPFRIPISQPGKPPPNSAPAASGRPNYMKSTSSSEARKERLLVSSPNSETCSDSKTLRRRNSSSSKLGLASGNKPMKSLTKVRTLTKTPSFKPIRGNTKKCSRVALCADMDVQRATCSSTLKDSKFPDYLMLNPGSTEAEGTSVTKVCPYTYCSLNGHHHTPMPPLKSFLKARRRSLKAQKSSKLEVLSPRGAKLFGDGAEEIESGLLVFFDDHKSPTQEVGTDFFIEIYTKDAEDGTEATEQGNEREPEQLSKKSSSCNDDEVPSGQDNEKKLEDEGNFYIQFEENPVQNSNIISVDMDIIGEFIEEQQVEDEDAEEPPGFPEEETTAGSFDDDNGSHAESKGHMSMEDYDTVSEVTDMEWEEGQFSASEDAEHDDGSLTDGENLSDIKRLDWNDNIKIVGSDDMVSDCTEDVLLDEVLMELFEEETASSNMECTDSELEEDGIAQNSEIIEATRVIYDLIYDEISSAEDASKEETAIREAGKEAQTYLVDILMMSKSTEEPTTGSQNVETDCGKNNPGFEAALNSHEGEGCLRAADANPLLQNKISDSSQDLLQKGLAGTEEDSNKDQKLQDSQVDQDSSIGVLPVNTELSPGIQIFDSSKSFSEDNQDDAELIYSKNNIITESYELDDTVEDSDSSKNLVDESKMEETHMKGSCDDEANKLNIRTAEESEESSNSRIYQICSGVNNTPEIEKKQMEICTETDTAETFHTINHKTSSGSECTFQYARKIINQDVNDTCAKRKWTIGCKKPIKDVEHERKFNPKEPNFLPVVPDPEAEKVDLKHQMIDDRKNAEEWMLDHALQQAVHKLAPAKQRKVALLVEAFETVLPIPKYESRIRHTSSTFPHTRTIQACN